MADTANMSSYRRGNSHRRMSPEMRMPEVLRMGKDMVARQVRALICVSHQYRESLGSKELKSVKQIIFKQKEIVESIDPLSKSLYKILIFISLNFWRINRLICFLLNQNGLVLKLCSTA